MSLVLSAEKITPDLIDNTKFLAKLKKNAYEHLPENFDDNDIFEVISGIIIRSINESSFRNIDPSINNSPFQLLIEGIYRHCIYNICKPNSYILQKYIKGEINPKHIALIPDFEKAPERWNKIRTELEEKENVKTSTNTFITSITCEKCGSNTIHMATYATRSADEAETRFFSCMTCDHRWRES